MPDLFLFYIYTSVWQQTRMVLGCCAFLVPLPLKLEKNSGFTSRLNYLEDLNWNSSHRFYRSAASSELSGLPRFLYALVNLSEERICAAWLFNCQIPSGSDVIWCHVRVQKRDDNFTRPPCPALCCGVTVCVCVCVSSAVCLCVKERGRVKEWVFGTGRIWPCSPSPQSAELWPGQAETVSWRRLRFGGKLPDALIKLMLFVDFLCMDASVPACQRALSHASLVENHALLLQNVLRRGVSCPQCSAPATLSCYAKKITWNLCVLVPWPHTVLSLPAEIWVKSHDADLCSTRNQRYRQQPIW